MVGNATNWTFVDQMREPSGGGIIRAVGEPYIDAFGEFSFLFYVMLIGMTMGMAYQRSHDVYAPLFVLMVSGGVMSALVPQAAALGTTIIALALAGLIIKVIWERR